MPTPAGRSAAAPAADPAPVPVEAIAAVWPLLRPDAQVTLFREALARVWPGFGGPAPDAREAPPPAAPAPEPGKAHWTVQEYAEHWGISDSLAYRLVQRGLVRAAKIGGRIRIPAAEAVRPPDLSAADG